LSKKNRLYNDRCIYITFIYYRELGLRQQQLFGAKKFVINSFITIGALGGAIFLFYTKKRLLA
jgi:hypothetical protein